MANTASDFQTIDKCRSCGDSGLELILDLGQLPLSDGLVRPEFDRSDEAVYPLTLVWCPTCSLVQILETVDPSTLFGSEYPYFSSFSPALVEHARRNVDGIIARSGVAEDSLVVELASNDGYLLQWFHKEGIPVLGIDPAPGPAAAAEESGIPTVCDFFTPSLATRLRSEGRSADVIIGNNVLAHVPDQNAFVNAIEILLAPDGLVVMEFPYVRDLVERCEFDTIYHEHHCYFSVHAVQRLFERHGLRLVSVEHHDIHGGSLRAFFSRIADADESVNQFLEAEVGDGMLDAGYYAAFAGRVSQIKDGLKVILGGLKDRGYRIGAYGAAAKGAILINYCGIDESVLDYVVDRNHHKHGWEMPGIPLSIQPTEHLRVEPVDYLLILAWNFKDEIMRQQAWFAEQGGRFIVPIPDPVVV